MRMGEVSKLLKRPDNTIRVWAEAFAEFFSTTPAKGETRHFTDDDLRVLYLIGQLSDKGLNRASIRAELQRQTDDHNLLPPLPPEMLQSEEDASLPALPLEVVQRLEAKDREIGRLSATVEQQRDQIMSQQTKFDELLEKYMTLSERLSQKHQAEMTDLFQRMGALQHQLQAVETGRLALEKETTDVATLREQLIQSEARYRAEKAAWEREIAALRNQIDEDSK